jgi:hypothetical protein
LITLAENRVSEISISRLRRGFEVLPSEAASSMRNFKSKSGSRIIDLLVSL